MLGERIGRPSVEQPYAVDYLQQGFSTVPRVRIVVDLLLLQQTTRVQISLFGVRP